MKLYYYELKKVCATRWVVFLLIILLLLCGIITAIMARPSTREVAVRKTYEMYMQDPTTMEVYADELEDLFMANIRDETYRLPATYCDDGDFDDLVILQDVFARSDYLKGHGEAMKKIQLAAQRRVADLMAYGYSTQHYEVRAEQALAQTYGDLVSTVNPRGEYAYGYDTYLQSTWVSLFPLLFITVVATYLFGQETQSGASILLRASAMGRLHTAIAKLAALLTVGLSGTILFLVTGMLAVGIACGYSSPLQAAQSLPLLSTMPYGLTIGEYLVLHAFLVLLVCTVYALFVSAFAALRISYMGCLLVGVLLGGFSGLFFLYPYEGTAPSLRWLNLAALLEGNDFLSFYRTVAIGEIPVSHIMCMVVVCLLTSILLGTLTAYFFCHIRVVQGPSFKKRHEKQMPFSKKIQPVASRKSAFSHKCGRPLWWYELNKMRPWICLAIVGLLLTGKCVFLASTAGDMERYDEARYRTYITDLQALSKESRDEYLMAERSRLNNILNAYEANKLAYEFGKMDSQSYYVFLEEYHQAVSENTIFIQVERYVDYIRIKNAATGLEGDILYTRGYEVFFGYGVDWFLIGAVLLVCGNTFSLEYRKNKFNGVCAPVLRATYGGRGRTARAKFLTFGIIGMVLSVLFRLTGLFLVACRYELPNPAAYLFTIQRFATVDSSISIWGYMTLDILLSALYGLLLAWLICGLSCLLRKLPLVLCAFLFVTALPELLANLSSANFNRVLLGSLAHPQVLMELSARVELGDWDFALLLAVVVIHILLTVLLVVVSLFHFCGKTLVKKEQSIWN